MTLSEVKKLYYSENFQKGGEMRSEEDIKIGFETIVKYVNRELDLVGDMNAFIALYPRHENFINRTKFMLENYGNKISNFVIPGNNLEPEEIKIILYLKFNQLKDDNYIINYLNDYMKNKNKYKDKCIEIENINKQNINDMIQRRRYEVAKKKQIDAIKNTARTRAEAEAEVEAEARARAEAEAARDGHTGGARDDSIQKGGKIRSDEDLNIGFETVVKYINHELDSEEKIKKFISEHTSHGGFIRKIILTLKKGEKPGILDMPAANNLELEEIKIILYGKEKNMSDKDIKKILRTYVDRPIYDAEGNYSNAYGLFKDDEKIEITDENYKNIIENIKSLIIKDSIDSIRKNNAIKIKEAVKAAQEAKTANKHALDQKNIAETAKAAAKKASEAAKAAEKAGRANEANEAFKAAIDAASKAKKATTEAASEAEKANEAAIQADIANEAVKTANAAEEYVKKADEAANRAKDLAKKAKEFAKEAKEATEAAEKAAEDAEKAAKAAEAAEKAASEKVEKQKLADEEAAKEAFKIAEKKAVAKDAADIGAKEAAKKVDCIGYDDSFLFNIWLKSVNDNKPIEYAKLKCNDTDIDCNNFLKEFVEGDIKVKHDFIKKIVDGKKKKLYDIKLDEIDPKLALEFLSSIGFKKKKCADERVHQVVYKVESYDQWKNRINDSKLSKDDNKTRASDQKVKNLIEKLIYVLNNNLHYLNKGISPVDEKFYGSVKDEDIPKLPGYWEERGLIKEDTKKWYENFIKMINDKWTKEKEELKKLNEAKGNLPVDLVRDRPREGVVGIFLNILDPYGRFKGGARINSALESEWDKIKNMLSKKNLKLMGNVDIDEKLKEFGELDSKKDELYKIISDYNNLAKSTNLNSEKDMVVLVGGFQELINKSNEKQEYISKKLYFINELLNHVN